MGGIDSAAVALLAVVLERHFTLDRTMKGTDQGPAPWSPTAWRFWCRHVVVLLDGAGPGEPREAGVALRRGGAGEDKGTMKRLCRGFPAKTKLATGTPREGQITAKGERGNGTAGAMEKHKEYIIPNGLDRLVDFQEDAGYEEGVFDAVKAASCTSLFHRKPTIWSACTP